MRATDRNGSQQGLVGIEDVAGMLGVGVRHVRRLVADRRIPYLKWGHLLRFDPVEIDAWLEEARRPVRPEAVPVPAPRFSRGRPVGRPLPPAAG